MQPSDCCGLRTEANARHADCLARIIERERHDVAYIRPVTAPQMQRRSRQRRWRVSELLGTSLGQYQVVELIGQGGMARVYKAYQPRLDRYVAIKVIPDAGCQRPGTGLPRRFTVEARLIARLAHSAHRADPRFGEDAGWAFIVMEYIAQGTVRERLLRPRHIACDLSLSWVLTVIEQAADALDFAHANGVVHRDVKPGNMLLRSEDYVLLSDFGIATILARAARPHIAGLARWARRNIWRPNRRLLEVSSMAAPTFTRSASCSSNVSRVNCRSMPNHRWR